MINIERRPWLKAVCKLAHGIIMVGAPKVVVISRRLSTGDRDGRAGDLSSSSSSSTSAGGAVK